MNYKGLCFLVIFILVHYIVYIYLHNKYISENNTYFDVKYILPPITFEYYFKFKYLLKYYNNIFG